MNNFFKQMANELNLGNLLSNPSRLYGGLTHKMYLVETDKGKYVVKLLNKNIMKRSNALDNFSKTEEYEKLLEKNNIPCIYSLEFDGKKMQRIEDQYYYVFNYYDGKSLKDDEIYSINCERIGKQLALIHNITLKEDIWVENTKIIDWKYYIDLAKGKESPIYNLLYDKIELLNKSMNDGNKVVNELPNYIAVCHNDLDSKNVLWKDEEFRIIDLECLDYSNPYLELFTLALCWSGYESCNINIELFKTFIDSYFDNSKLSRNINWEVIYYANNGRLDWLLYNIKRALLIETNSKEEQELGINEVKETIKHIEYYDKIKDKILEALK